MKYARVAAVVILSFIVAACSGLPLTLNETERTTVEGVEVSPHFFCKAKKQRSMVLVLVSNPNETPATVYFEVTAHTEDGEKPDGATHAETLKKGGLTSNERTAKANTTFSINVYSGGTHIAMAELGPEDPYKAKDTPIA